MDRPSMQAVRRSLIMGILAGIVLGCVLGMLLSYGYVRRYPPVYTGGAYPPELTKNYQDHYTAMVIDSYIVTRDVNTAQQRLQAFSLPVKIKALGERSAGYVVNGQAAEAAATNELAVALRDAEKWDPNVISAAVQELNNKHQGKPEAQGVVTFAEALGQVPQQPPPAVSGTPPPPAAGAATPPPPKEPESGGNRLQIAALCLLLLVLVLAIGFVVYKRFLGSDTKPKKPQIVWDEEKEGGPPPIKQWQGTYTYGQDNYDEFFTIETDDGIFLGESGMGILEVVSGTKPKQVMAFDVGLFDKTDITTLSRVLMTKSAYNDEALRTKISVNPQAEAVLAEPDKKFVLKTTAMRVEVEIKELELGKGDGGQDYYEKLTIMLNIFINEGADLRVGEMDIPEKFQ